MSWIFLEIPPGNLLEICSVNFVDTLKEVSACLVVDAHVKVSCNVSQFITNIFRFFYDTRFFVECAKLSVIIYCE